MPGWLKSTLVGSIIFGSSIILLSGSFDRSGGIPDGPGLIDFKGSAYQVYIVNLYEDSVAMFHKDGDQVGLGNFDRLNDYLKSKNKDLLFATNAGMFSPTFEPVGLFIKNGKIIQPLDTNDGKGNFYMKPNGVFSIHDNGTGSILVSDKMAKSSKEHIQFASQSGPMLLINGEIHPEFREGSRSKYIRSGVGQIAPGTFVFAISRKPVNFFSFASFFKEYYGCKMALYLDGAISEFYIKGESEFPLLNKQRFGVMIGHYR